MKAIGGQQWRLQFEARPSKVPEIRHQVVDVLERECPGVDLSVAALVVTELAANVVKHAYEEPGQVEVEVVCEPDAAVITLRDGGRGFRRSTGSGMGIGLQLVAALTEWLRIDGVKSTEVKARLSRAHVE